MSLRRSPEGVPILSLEEITNGPSAITSQAISQAFAPTSLGVIIIDGLPSTFPALRERLLRFANTFGSLDPQTKAQFEDPLSSYSFGWSEGKEVMNGKPDLAKGSFYNNPILDLPNVPEDVAKANPMYYRPNIWPTKEICGKSWESLSGFEESFKEVGGFVVSVGRLLGHCLEEFVSANLLDASQSIEGLIATSQCNKARLLHYFSPLAESESASAANVDSLCGVHKDHSIITGLLSNMWISPCGEEIPAPFSNSGLHIVPPGVSTEDAIKVSIPSDALAFQTGEAIEILTGGKLRATPHYVAYGSGNLAGAKGVTRETLAVFLQPDTGAVLTKDGKTFGEFSKEVLERHY